VLVFVFCVLYFVFVGRGSGEKGVGGGRGCEFLQVMIMKIYLV